MMMSCVTDWDVVQCVFINLHSRWYFQYRESFDTNEINVHIENNLFSLIKNQNEIVSEEKN
jgi:hypothetical protein